MCIVGVICGVGVLLLLARSVAQATTDPQLVTNKENPEGFTVCHFPYCERLIPCVKQHLHYEATLMKGGCDMSHITLFTHHRVQKFVRSMLSGSVTLLTRLHSFLMSLSSST